MTARDRGGGDVVVTHITAATVPKPRVPSTRPTLTEKERERENQRRKIERERNGLQLQPPSTDVDDRVAFPNATAPTRGISWSRPARPKKRDRERENEKERSRERENTGRELTDATALD